MEQNEMMKLILEKLTSMEKRFDSLEKKVDDGFDQLKQKLDTHHFQNIEADEKILSLLVGLSKNMGRIEKIEKRQAISADKIESLEADVSILKEKLAE